jgi:hypothetical protein
LRQLLCAMLGLWTLLPARRADGPTLYPQAA